jgi:hypothetical protein
VSGYGTCPVCRGALEDDGFHVCGRCRHGAQFPPRSAPWVWPLALVAALVFFALVVSVGMVTVLGGVWLEGREGGFS